MHTPSSGSMFKPDPSPMRSEDDPDAELDELIRTFMMDTAAAAPTLPPLPSDRADGSTEEDVGEGIALQSTLGGQELLQGTLLAAKK